MSKGSMIRVLLIFTVIAILGSLILVPVAQGDGPLYTTMERFGVGVSPNVGHSISDYDLSDFCVGWYSDWRFAANPDLPDGIEFVQLIDVDMEAGGLVGSTAAMAAAASANPGALWIIGNEPENYWRGKCSPREYASLYNQAYTLIKGADPTARIAVGGVTEPTPLRLEWLEYMLDYYAQDFGVDMREHIDVWTVHVQITPERRNGWGARIPIGEEFAGVNEGETFGISMSDFSPNADVRIFKQLVYDFCEWMADQGEREKELIISEYGVLYPSDYLDPASPANGDQMVIDFMLASFDFLLSSKNSVLGLTGDEGRLVQRWLWYSLNEKPYDVDPDVGFNGSLFEWDDPTQLTIFGEAYRDYIYKPFKVFLPVTRKP